MVAIPAVCRLRAIIVLQYAAHNDAHHGCFPPPPLARTAVFTAGERQFSDAPRIGTVLIFGAAYSMSTPFGAFPPARFAAFAGAAAQFFELLKVFGAQAAAPQARAGDWTSLGEALGAQFEQWLKASPAAGGFWLAAALPAGSTAWPPGSAAAWSPGTIPLGPAAVPGEPATASWELLVKLAQLQGELASHWSAIAAGSAQLFGARAPTHDGPLTRERALALYELWVDCAEEAYAARVHRDDFCRLQGELVNTALALLLAQRRQADALARAWGLPTREEADALQRQIRELRAQLAGQKRPAQAPGPRAQQAPQSEPTRAQRRTGGSAKGAKGAKSAKSAKGARSTASGRGRRPRA
jgi:hypothetical protein